MSTPLVFIDTETDGLHPGRKAWEIALIRRDHLGQTETQCGAVWTTWSLAVASCSP